LFKDAVVWEEQEILTQAGKPYTVFTPYSRAWKAKAIPLPRGKLGKTSNFQLPTPNIHCDPLPGDAGELEHVMKQAFTPAGERAALERLRSFMTGPVYEYAAKRNLLCPSYSGDSGLP
jgi:deoxyribodipyrimidine photo-lyase